MKINRTLTRIAGATAIAALGTLVPVASAAAASYPVPPVNPEVNPSSTPQVSPNNVARKPSTLPFTGGDVAELAAIGAIATGTGVVLVRRSRRAGV